MNRPAAARRPIGRRPGDPEETKQVILDAARQAFAASGFERATIRAIAVAADVDPALVLHHFGSKQNLFASAHELPFDPDELVTSVIETPLAERGEALTRLYLTVITAEHGAPLSLMRAAATNEQAAVMMREFVDATLLARAAELAPGADGDLRLAIAGSQLFGIGFARVVLGMGPLRRRSIEEIVEVVAPMVQRLLEPPGEVPAVAAH